MRQFKTLLTVIGAVTILVLAGNTIALATTGHAFILGQANSAARISKLTRTTSGAALNLTTKKSTNAPFSTNARGKVANLNADMLDGFDSSQLRTRSYVFRSSFAGKASVFLTLPVPNGNYIVSYSNFFSGVAASGIQCYVEEFDGTSTRFTGYSAFNYNTTGGSYDPAISGSGFAAKVSGGFIGVDCDSGGSTFSTPAETPMEVVVTPTTVISKGTVVPTRVAPRRH